MVLFVFLNGYEMKFHVKGSTKANVYQGIWNQHATILVRWDGVGITTK